MNLPDLRNKAKFLQLLESKAIGDYHGLRARDLMLRVSAPTTAREADRMAGQAEDAMARLVSDTSQQMMDLVNRYLHSTGVVDRHLDTKTDRMVPKSYGTGITAQQLSRSLSEILRRVYFEIFLLGARSSRNPRATRNFDNFTPEELSWITNALRTEQGYLDRLVLGIVKNKNRWSIGYMRRRLQAYAQSSMAMFQAGKVAGLTPLSVIHWEARGDRGTCRECLLLRDFGPYLRHTLPCTPKSGCTRCLNNCRCTLRVQPATAEQIRVLQAIAYDKSYYLKLLNQSRSKPDNLPRVRGRQPAPTPRRRRIR